LAVKHVQETGEENNERAGEETADAKKAAAAKFTTRPRKVRRLGLMPVAAMAPTILSSSHLLPDPIAPVNVAISA